jgi:hypothetical protein
LCHFEEGSCSNVGTYVRIARWFVFKPKIPIWETISGSRIGKCWYILWPFGTFYGNLGSFVTIWYIWYIFSCFGIMHQEKSGNPDLRTYALKRSYVFLSKSNF